LKKHTFYDLSLIMHNQTISSPKIILIRPQMQENIGATARAMANFTLSELRLVNPREVLNEKAYATSAGATDILDNTCLFNNTQDSIADCHFILATTARHRDLKKPVYSLPYAIKILIEKQKQGLQCGLLFGPERTGLENNDIILADAIIMVDVNPNFASLNLAQCVLLIGYEYFKQLSEISNDISDKSYPKELASKQEIAYLLSHLIDELEKKQFFYPIEKRSSLIHLISNIFTRNQLTTQEVGTLRGIIKILSKNK
jgi:tRNA/rRNA methyltransferase